MNVELSSRSNNIDHIKILNFTGLYGSFTNTTIKNLRESDEVEYIEEDVTMYVANRQPNPENWGLSRISTRYLDDSIYGDYVFYDSAGYYQIYYRKGVDAYVIDSGVNYKHPEFEGRAKLIANFADNVNNDENGHGTHVCGIIGSKTFGVAKNVNIKAIKVFGASGGGPTSSIIRAIQYVVENRKKNIPSVINMSLGGSVSRALNDAVNQAFLSGIPVVVAAGNESKDACDTSPASAKHAFAVANTDQNDKLHYSSNYGKCVKISAPGTNIMSTYKEGKKLLTGTR